MSVLVRIDVDARQQRYVLATLEVKATFYVVDACRGFYPFETCHDFAARFTWDKNPICNVPDDGIDGNRWCYEIKARPQGGGEWQFLVGENALDPFGFVTFSTTQMTLLPDAPILKPTGSPEEAR